MIVKELIQRLQQLDENLPVGKFHDADRDGPDTFYEFKELDINTKKVYDMKSKKSNQYIIVTGVEIK
jgi:hypothetical protein